MLPNIVFQRSEETLHIAIGCPTPAPREAINVYTI